MPSQRDVKQRIDSVKNIRKITRAMEMVAAARLRRAEQRIAHLRPYAGAIRRMTRQAAEAAGGEVGKLPILQQHENEQTIAILLVTADRGLAGAFNSQILRAGIRAAADYEGEGRDVRFYASGRRGVSSLTFRGREVAGSYQGFTERPAYADAREIAEDLMAAYVDGKIDRVDILYNGYVSPLVQEVRRETLLPLQEATILEKDEDEDDDEGTGHHALVEYEPGPEAILYNGYVSPLLQEVRRETLLPLQEATILETSDDEDEGTGHHALVEYEPGPEQILERLIPDYVEISLYRALLESSASELGARMTAMRNASQNAAEVIEDLTLEMNRARQAEITQEIMEVVAGAEALV